MKPLKITNSFTNRDDISLEKYLQEISKVDLLTAEEEVELAKKIKQGDQISLEKLINANLRFVVSVAKQYPNKDLSLSDLINEGNLGLIKAAQRFDDTKGFKFISYAVWWIRQSILQALSDKSRIVRLPVSAIREVKKIKKTSLILLQNNEWEPSVEELSTLLGMPTEEVEISLSFTRHISIDAPFKEVEDNSLLDVLENTNTPATDSILYKKDLSIEIERALSTLSYKQADILKRFFGIGLERPQSLEEIAEKSHRTHENIRKIKEQAIKKLQSESRNKLLKQYLGR